MADSEELRVLMLCGKLGEGGAPKVVLNAGKHLRESVDAVTVGYFGGRDELVPRFEELNIPVVRLGSSPGDAKCGRSLWNLLSSFQPSVVHTHMVSAGVWGRILGRLKGIPVVSTIHTAFPNRSVPARSLDLATSPLATVNVPVSNAVKSSLPASFGIGTQCTVVHNCIDPADIRRQGRVSWSDLEWNDGIDESQPIIANVTRFDPKKRKVDLVRALPAIRAEHPDAVLVLTGWGDARARVEAVAESLGMNDTTFFLGHVSNPYSVYRHAEVVAFPSVSEGFSIGILEAMAFGKPIVATEIPPFREALGDDSDLVPTRDPGALADAVNDRLRDRARASKRGDLLRERVEREFSGSAAAKGYLEIYESVTG